MRMALEHGAAQGNPPAGVPLGIAMQVRPRQRAIDARAPGASGSGGRQRVARTQGGSRASARVNDQRIRPTESVSTAPRSGAWGWR